MNSRASYWLDLAEYDLETARAMLETGRYLYVGFMCHQAIEKAIKGVIASLGIDVPYIHNLAKLAHLAGLYGKLSDGQKHTLAVLDPLNIQARYPEDKGRLAAVLSRDRCTEILRQTEEMYEWTRSTL